MLAITCGICFLAVQSANRNATIFTNFSAAHIIPFAHTRLLWLVLMAIIITAHALPTRLWVQAQRRFIAAPWVVKLALFLIVTQATIQLAGESVAPFIYFQF